MQLEELLEKATPRPWGYIELLADGFIIREGGTYEIRTREFDVAAQMPGRGPIRRLEDAVALRNAIKQAEEVHSDDV